MSISSHSIQSGAMPLYEFQQKAKELERTYDIKSVDLDLRRKIQEFKSLDRQGQLYKIGAYASAIFPIIGWISAYLMCQKREGVANQKKALLQNAIQQISKDTNRKYAIFLNGVKHTNPRSLEKALNRHEISDLQKYTILQLSHQGLYATLLKGNLYQLLNWSNKHAPLTQEESAPLKRQIKKEGTPNPYIHVTDITPAMGKSIYLHVGEKKCDLYTQIRQGVVVYDRSAPSPHQGRTIFEFDTSCTIDLKSGQMHLLPHLSRINPLEGPVASYPLTEDKEESPTFFIPPAPLVEPKKESFPIQALPSPSEENSPDEALSPLSPLQA